MTARYLPKDSVTQLNEELQLYFGGSIGNYYMNRKKSTKGLNKSLTSTKLASTRKAQGDFNDILNQHLVPSGIRSSKDIIELGRALITFTAAFKDSNKTLALAQGEKDGGGLEDAIRDFTNDCAQLLAIYNLRVENFYSADDAKNYPRFVSAALTNMASQLSAEDYPKQVAHLLKAADEVTKMAEAALPSQGPISEIQWQELVCGPVTQILHSRDLQSLPQSMLSQLAPLETSSHLYSAEALKVCNDLLFVSPNKIPGKEFFVFALQLIMQTFGDFLQNKLRHDKTDPSKQKDNEIAKHQAQIAFAQDLLEFLVKKVGELAAKHSADPTPNKASICMRELLTALNAAMEFNNCFIEDKVTRKIVNDSESDPQMSKELNRQLKDVIDKIKKNVNADNKHTKLPPIKDEDIQSTSEPLGELKKFFQSRAPSLGETAGPANLPADSSPEGTPLPRSRTPSNGAAPTAPALPPKRRPSLTVTAAPAEQAQAQPADEHQGDNDGQRLQVPPQPPQPRRRAPSTGAPKSGQRADGTVGKDAPHGDGEGASQQAQAAGAPTPPAVAATPAQQVANGETRAAAGPADTESDASKDQTTAAKAFHEQDRAQGDVDIGESAESGGSASDSEEDLTAPPTGIVDELHQRLLKGAQLRRVPDKERGEKKAEEALKRQKKLQRRLAAAAEAKEKAPAGKGSAPTGATPPAGNDVKGASSAAPKEADRSGSAGAETVATPAASAKAATSEAKAEGGPAAALPATPMADAIGTLGAVGRKASPAVGGDTAPAAAADPSTGTAPAMHQS